MCVCIVDDRICDEQNAYPLFDLIWKKRTNHGEDRSEEHWLVDQMDSSNFQWKRVLNTHTHTHRQKQRGGAD